jgi:hypothetical protein
VVIWQKGPFIISFFPPLDDSAATKAALTYDIDVHLHPLDPNPLHSLSVND